jgi:hypothetical protein
MRTISAVGVTFLVLATLLWIGGELHRQNCIRDHRAGCSVLPWDNGKPETSSNWGTATPSPPPGTFP